MIEHVESASDVKIGARIMVPWPASACSNPDEVKHRFLQVAEAFAWIN
jgi:hypothetical protein